MWLLQLKAHAGTEKRMHKKNIKAHQWHNAFCTYRKTNNIGKAIKAIQWLLPQSCRFLLWILEPILSWQRVRFDLALPLFSGPRTVRWKIRLRWTSSGRSPRTRRGCSSRSRAALWCCPWSPLVAPAGLARHWNSTQKVIFFSRLSLSRNTQNHAHRYFICLGKVPGQQVNHEALSLRLYKPWTIRTTQTH